VKAKNGVQSVLRIFRMMHEFLTIVIRRLRVQGLGTTLLWLYAVGVARITGRVPLRYSRITPHLYVGPQFGRRGKSALQRIGVTAAISLRAEFDDKAHGLALTQYHYLPIIDNTAPTLKQLEEGVAFIRSIISAEGSVYVHCGSGVGRAPSMAAAYLIAEGLPVDDAVAQIEQVRPFIRILPAQMERLREYETCVRAGTPTPEPEIKKPDSDIKVEGHIQD
jgi:protein-tyrosine phosphatase